jgi:dephospho-CoA kinase
MYVIGITGPSGAGKTTALRVLEQMGGKVYDCDAVYHEMLETSGELLGRIEAAFPGAVTDYVLDRKALGARVFADPEGLQRLTDITQPLVKRRVLEEIQASDAASSVIRPAGDAGCRLPLKGKALAPSPVPCSLFPVPSRFAVIDAIGLFESGLGEACDLTVAVTADEEVRVRRLMVRDSIPEDYARARIAAQKPADWYSAQADITLENNGSEADFAQTCRDVFAAALREALPGRASAASSGTRKGGLS